jgi:octaprenyl-diphosphate synthase
MNKLEKIEAPVKEELKIFRGNSGKSLNSDLPLLNIIMRYILRRKGKQIRPLLVFLIAKLNGQINDSTYTAAMLVEFLHTATLIHEDVVDESYERRGFLSINAIWKSKIAVLTGDYLLAKGLLLAVEKKAYNILETISDAVREMSEGELLQVEKSRKLSLNKTEYFEIMRKKSATLISACATCGAQSVTQDRVVFSKMKEFGLLIGLTFQIKDDLLDYEKSSLTGKPKGNDNQEKKLTLPLIVSLENAGNAEQRQIIKLINKKDYNRETYNRIFKFVHEMGGIEYSKNLMLQYQKKATILLKEYSENPVRIALTELVDYIVNREN